MTQDDEQDLMDDLGMQSGTCPRCGHTVYTDTGFFECDSCGYSEDDQGR